MCVRYPIPGSKTYDRKNVSIVLFLHFYAQYSDISCFCGICALELRACFIHCLFVSFIPSVLFGYLRTPIVSVLHAHLPAFFALLSSIEIFAKPLLRTKFITVFISVHFQWIFHSAAFTLALLRMVLKLQLAMLQVTTLSVSAK